uniref:Uncharacterized protein n=1 Tax=Ornithodoros erraticus TaxID=265619 RepID=A0A293N5F0_ORNER
MAVMCLPLPRYKAHGCHSTTWETHCTATEVNLSQDNSHFLSTAASNIKESQQSTSILPFFNHVTLGEMWPMQKHRTSVPCKSHGSASGDLTFCGQS